MCDKSECTDETQIEPSESKWSKFIKVNQPPPSFYCGGWKPSLDWKIPEPPKQDETSD